MIKRNIIFIHILLLILSCGSDSSANAPIDDIIDCMEPEACNYNPDATSEGFGDISLCWYPNSGCECSDGENAILDCNNECNGNASYDSCGVCSGGSTDNQPGLTCGLIENGCDLPINTIGFVPKLGNDIYGTVIYNIDPNNIIGVGGFQFVINNANLIENQPGGEYNPAIPFFGGDAYLEGLSVYTENGLILGVSLSGNAIQVSNNQLCGELVNIAYDNSFTSNSDEVSLSNIVFSNTVGQSIEVSYEDTCLEAKYDCYGFCDGDAYIDLCSNCVEGLTNQEDCTDGYIDCYGNIGIDAYAVIDECGVCDGDGIADGTCDCDGNVLDCAGECGGSTVVDNCGVCGGDSSSCAGNGGGDIENACDLPINNILLDTETGDVWYNADTAISGFQWTVDGTTASGAAGGVAATAGFTVQTSGATVLGFSFTGSSIPTGCGTLTTLTLVGDAAGFSGLVFSDTSASEIPFTYYNGN